MAVFSFNPDEIVEPIVAILNDDTTLEGANYLDKTSKKVWSLRAPSKAEAPYIVVEAALLSPANFSLNTCEMRIHVYTELLSNGQIGTRNGLILKQCEELLNNVTPAITNGAAQPLYAIGVVPAYSNETMGKKAKSVLRLRAEIGKTA